MTFLLEVVGGAWASVMGVGLEYFWAVAWLSLGGLALLFPNWRHLVLATSAPGLIGVVLILLFMPESPRWLFIGGRREEAEEIVRKGASINGNELAPGWKLLEDQDVKVGQAQSASFFDIFR